MTNDNGIVTCRWYRESDAAFVHALAERQGYSVYEQSLVVVAEHNGAPFAFAMFKLDDQYKDELVAKIPTFVFQTEVTSVTVCQLMLATVLEYVACVIDDIEGDNWAHVEREDTFEIADEFVEGNEKEQFEDDMRPSGRFIQATEIAQGTLISRLEFMRSIGFVGEIVDGQAVLICR